MALVGVALLDQDWLSEDRFGVWKADLVGVMLRK